MLIPPEQHRIANMREYIQVLQVLAGSVKSAILKNRIMGKLTQLAHELEDLDQQIQR